MSQSTKKLNEAKAKLLDSVGNPDSILDECIGFVNSLQELTQLIQAQKHHIATSDVYTNECLTQQAIANYSTKEIIAYIVGSALFASVVGYLTWRFCKKTPTVTHTHVHPPAVHIHPPAVPMPPAAALPPPAGVVIKKTPLLGQLNDLVSNSFNPRTRGSPGMVLRSSTNAKAPGSPASGSPKS